MFDETKCSSIEETNASYCTLVCAFYNRCMNDVIHAVQDKVICEKLTKKIKHSLKHSKYLYSKYTCVVLFNSRYWFCVHLKFYWLFPKCTTKPGHFRIFVNMSNIWSWIRYQREWSLKIKDYSLIQHMIHVLQVFHASVTSTIFTEAVHAHGYRIFLCHRQKYARNCCRNSLVLCSHHLFDVVYVRFEVQLF